MKTKEEKINKVKKVLKEKNKAAQKILKMLKQQFKIKDEYEIKIKCSPKYCNICCYGWNTYCASIKIQHPTLDTVVIKCKTNDDFSIMEILSIKFNDDDREIIVNGYNECKDGDFNYFKRTANITIVEAKKLTELYEYLSE